MKKLATLCVLAFAWPTMADVTVNLYNGYGAGSGGEFDVQNVTGSFGQIYTALGGLQSGLGSWATFCVERDEYISFGTTYKATISTQAVRGGNNTPFGDPLSNETAYLYRQFALGTLSNYDYTNASLRPGDADALQNAIWYLENEFSIGGTYNYAVTLANASTYFGGTTGQSYLWISEAFTNATGLGGVRVMNLWDVNNGSAKQSQLILVPAPAAVLLSVFGVGLAGWVKRRLG